MPADLNAIAETLTSLSNDEMKQLGELVTEKWGVILTEAPTFVAPTPVEIEQTEFTVTLTGFGASKVEVIKAVREITLLGLKESKDLVDAIPKVIKAGVDKAEAKRVQDRLVAAGATVTVQ